MTLMSDEPESQKHVYGLRGFMQWDVWYPVILTVLILSMLGALALKSVHSWEWVGIHFYAAPIAGAGIVLAFLFLVMTMGAIMLAMTHGLP